MRSLVPRICLGVSISCLASPLVAFAQPAAAAVPVAAPVAAPVDPPPSPDSAAGEIVNIEGTAPAESASSIHLDRAELEERPHEQPSDLFRQVPGLVVAQHAGGGKADQWFIRGFDADHGTDIAVFVDGVPVNLTSHAHGQGYADTHWLIPETVASIDVHKGPYAARFGDFYTAAAVETATIDTVPGGAMLEASSGIGLAGPEAWKRPSGRLVGMVSPTLADGTALFAAQVAFTNGPFIDKQDFQNGAVLGTWKRRLGDDGSFTIESTYYQARWNASGQVPSSLVDSGQLDRFGSIDPTEGGTTSRASISSVYEVHDHHDGTWHLGAYLVGYRLRLYSDFTHFARDPANGDEIEQDDRRSVYGLDAYTLRPHQLGDLHGRLRLGVQARADDVDTELWHVAARQRLFDCFGVVNPCNDDRDAIRNLGVYAEEEIAPARRVELQAGLRLDQYTWDVDDLNPATAATPATTGGSAQKMVVNPKLSAIWHATDDVDVFANSGGGYHSNDARAAVASHGNGALARALGAEAGVRVHFGTRFHGSADFWYLQLSSEQVWSGDEGGTVAAGATERYGLDLEGAADLTDWLSVDANVALAHSVFVADAGNGSALALAPKLMGGGGVIAHQGKSFVALRARGIGSRPANDDNTLTAQGYVLVDLIAGTHVDRWDFGVTAVNLLNAAWREAQFADTIATSPGAPAAPQVDFTPGMPLTIFATVATGF